MKVLVVGAGAVGQVYGRALVRGGAKVTYLVKPKHLEEARKGFVLYPFNEGREPVRFTDYELVTEPGPGYDVIILTIPTPAMRVPGFLEDLAARSGDAAILTTQPGLEDAALVAQHVGEERTVVGMIGLMAYFAPLPGETLPEPGVAYWLPPGAGCHVSGARARPIAKVLHDGGLRSKVLRDVVLSRAFGGAVLDSFVSGLEAAGWNAATLKGDRELRRLTARAARESAAITARARNVKVPFGLSLLGPTAVRLVVGLLGKLAPFDIATFFKVHYTKVGEQRRTLAAETEARAHELGVAIPSLEALHQRAAGAAA